MNYYKVLNAACVFFIALALLSGAALVFLSLGDKGVENIPSPSGEELSGAVARAPLPAAARAGAPPKVNFTSYPRAIPQRVRRIIEEEAALPPNFARRYRVVAWRCGTSCRAASVVDQATGNLVAHGIPFTRLAYRADDNLLAVYWGEYSDVYTADAGALLLVAKLDTRGNVTLPSQCPELPLRALNPATGEERAFSSPCRVPWGWQWKNKSAFLSP